jgi:hypothetical protein
MALFALPETVVDPKPSTAEGVGRMKDQIDDGR